MNVRRLTIILPLLFLLLISLIYLLNSNVPAQASTEPLAEVQYKEDYNGDGNVNIADVIFLLLLARDNPGEPRADYNEDGTYNITDAIALLLSIRDGKQTPLNEPPELVLIYEGQVVGDTVSEAYRLEDTILIVPVVSNAEDLSSLILSIQDSTAALSLGDTVRISHSNILYGEVLVVTVTAVDSLGLADTASTIVSLTDDTAPGLSGEINGVPLSDGYQMTVTAGDSLAGNWSGSDDYSGIRDIITNIYKPVGSQLQEQGSYTGSPFSHSFSEAGTHKVVATVTDNAGNETTLEGTINVSEPVDSTLSNEDKFRLTELLQTISKGWVQSAVDSANIFLSNPDYNSLVWKEFFEEYFSSNAFTDSLRNYIVYPVFYWFSDKAHLNLQVGILNSIINKIDSIMINNRNNLGNALDSDSLLWQSLHNSHKFMADMIRSGIYSDSIRFFIYDYYKGHIIKYEELFKKNVTIDIFTSPFVPTIRAQVYLNLRNTLPLDENVINDIAMIINLKGDYLDIWDNHNTLILDNNGLDMIQLEVIKDFLNMVPSDLFKLDAISVNEYLGNTGGRYTWLIANYAINIFNVKVGQHKENGFPEDISPKYTDVFSIVVAHELNHVVDAYYINNNKYKERKDILIEQAGNSHMNYLRSMFEDEFFSNAPQEFFASISNQYFCDSKNTMDLGLVRFDNGYKEPINQFLFFADVYSLDSNTTFFYTTDTLGNINREPVKIERDNNSNINKIILDKIYIFDLDESGNVQSYVNGG